ncbi:acyl-CoA N-acyltransferase [Geopyxis carbonaria]|nr:acyl-CoA N-acyltransferase [Geopyxis carbonaria]
MHKIAPKVKIGTTSDYMEFSTVYLGKHLIIPWYAAAYPKRLVDEASSEQNKLYVCEFCFKYTTDLKNAVVHMKLCKFEPQFLGIQVHQTSGYTIYEVDGRLHPLFCQNLSLFSKMFLDTKSICYDVQSFLFYTVVEVNPREGRQKILGFFSKEKKSWDDYNLACILVFPPFQRRGLGKLLIAFSYELSKTERKIGSPEKPLSALGLRGYISYWSSAVASALIEAKQGSMSVRDLSEITYIHPDDIIITFKYMGILIKYQEGLPNIHLNWTVNTKTENR